MNRPLVIAHRGASGYETENSLAAFRAAVAQGADGVELDVHATADGALIVHHDEAIGGRHIPHSPLREIRGHRLTNGERVPTLEEALAAILPQLTAFVEVKSLAPRWDEGLFAAIDDSPAPGKVAIHGFDHRIVHRLGEKRPHLKLGVLSASYPVRPIRMLEDAGATTLWQAWRLVDEALVAAAHQGGVALYVWTVDRPEDIRRLAALGVDGICTNLPDVAREALALAASPRQEAPR